MDVKQATLASVDWAITLASLASSSTLVAGRQSASYDNSSNKALDLLLGGKTTNGTTPTANTLIEVWLIPKWNGSTWPDGFSTADAARTVTSRGQLATYGKLVAAHNIIAATSNLVWEYSASACAVLGVPLGSLPKQLALWVVHSTAVNLNSTGGNHVHSYTPIYQTVT